MAIAVERRDLNPLVYDFALSGGEKALDAARVGVALLGGNDDVGKVTAGNACPLNDGAAALVIMSEERAAEIGATPRARIIATAGCNVSIASSGGCSRA